MSTDPARGRLATIIVFSVLFVTVVIALTPVIGGYPPEPYTEHLRTFASLYSGLIGIVVGYYFGRSDQPRRSEPQDRR